MEMSLNTFYSKGGCRNRGHKLPVIIYSHPEQSDSAHTFIFSQVWATLHIYSYYPKCMVP